MVPEEELMSKPIKLRNACIFYLGHIPTFLDMHLTRATKEPSTEPAYFPKIFERGIDPDVDNPEQCHVHSEIPAEWPSLDVVLAFQSGVRQRVEALYASGVTETSHHVKKAMWIGFEHECMHLETLLYMLVQSPSTKPPTGAVKPDFETLAREARGAAVENEWFDVPARTITLGIDDDDKDVESARYFGWDNEKPAREKHVPRFKAKGRPITNGEYVHYMEQQGISQIPASWTTIPSASHDLGAETNGHATNGHAESRNGTSQHSFLESKAVRTVFGPVPLKFVLDWPVMASFDELSKCAKWMGGRIPTLEEAKSIYEYVEELSPLRFESSLSKTIPAVNRYSNYNSLELEHY